MLLGEQRGGDEHGDLPAVLHGLERRPHRHLGLAEPDVAADEPVHRHLGLHVGLDLDHGVQLVGGLAEREGRLELGLPGSVGGERVARCVQTGLVEHHELLRDPGDLGAHRRLGPGEVGAAELAEPRGLAARVEPHGLDLVRRHVQPVAASVLEEQVVPLDPAHRLAHHPAEPGDAVDVVDDVVADLQVLEEGLGVPAETTDGSPTATATAQVALGQQRHTGAREDAPGPERGHHDRQGVPELPAGRVGAREGHRRRETLTRQECGEAFGRGLGVGTDGDRHPVPAQRPDLGHERAAVGTR